jgi:uncharacterized protein (DUF2235 family)
MPKNIVVCCDGTGNEIGENISNVLKLYRVVRKTGKMVDQVAYYDPGVGTLARPDPWRKALQAATANLGLATGYGLDDHVLGAYRFLIQQYQDGDDVFLFGFSRGAHTVRILAGLIHMIGLLRPEQINLADAALGVYKQSTETPVRHDSAQMERDRSDDGGQPAVFSIDDRASQFARIVSTRWPTIKFLGVWDTVASVIVPRPDRFYTFSLQTLPFTEKNPSVRIFRQAIAVDERRRMFRLSRWDDGQTFMSNRFSPTNNSEPQDCKQVWFAGVHADVGGGYPEAESTISKFPLIWMIEEAKAFGLSVNQATVNQLAWGKQRAGSPFTYVAPDCSRPVHDSLIGAWPLLEWIPKNDRYKEWPRRQSFMHRYLPQAEPRVIPENAKVHQSVIDKQRIDGDYRPINLPDSYEIEPYSHGPS